MKARKMKRNKETETKKKERKRKETAMEEVSEWLKERLGKQRIRDIKRKTDRQTNRKRVICVVLLISKDILCAFFSIRRHFYWGTHIIV